MTHLFAIGVSGEEMVFDPIDTEDNAVFEQGLSSSLFREQQNMVPNTKASNVFNDQRSGKKDKEAKYFPQDIVCFISDEKNKPYEIENAMNKPFISKRYNYLFFQEINPPPPKVS